mgnify:FL=1
MDCTEVLELLGDYLDEDARTELCQTIRMHLRSCPDCQLEVDTVRMTITLYQADRHITTPIVVSARLQQLLARAYREVGEHETEA